MALKARKNFAFCVPVVVKYAGENKDMIIRRTPALNKYEFLSAARLIGALSSCGGTQVSPEELLFFDIETTGLSVDTSYLYLIGCMYLDDGEPVLSQFFSEGIAEENLLIEEFDRLLAVHPVPVHFNGSGFDIPYIEKKRTKLGLPHPDMREGGFDIYKSLKPYKTLLDVAEAS